MCRNVDAYKWVLNDEFNDAMNIYSFAATTDLKNGTTTTETQKKTTRKCAQNYTKYVWKYLTVFFFSSFFVEIRRKPKV